MNLRASIIPITIAAVLCMGTLTACSGAEPQASRTLPTVIAAEPAPTPTDEAPIGLLYPAAWDVPEVPNADSADVTWFVRFDGVLIDSTIVVPGATEADAVGWLASAAAQWGLTPEAGQDSVKGLGASGMMIASYQLDYNGGTLFRYHFGWGLPTGDASVPITLPAEWAALPLPASATYQNAWAQYFYSPKSTSTDWRIPTYFFSISESFADPRAMSEAWRVSLDPEEWTASGGDGGISLRPMPGTDLTGLPTFGR